MDDSAADAVVIGAGHNGLVGANLPSDAGWSVVVCEATSHMGGAVRMAEVAAPEIFEGAGGWSLPADLPPGCEGSDLYGWLLCMLGQTHGC
jgi:monoamine oxidase